MPRIGGFNADRANACLKRDVDDLGQWQIVSVRSLVIAPADVQPHAVRRQTRNRRVERRDVAFGDLGAEFIVAEVPVLIVARRAEIWRIDLQYEPGLDNGAV